MPPRAVALACALLMMVPRVAVSQRPPAPLSPQWELRADATVAPRPAGHAGAGINVRAGSYVRLGVAVLAGVASGPAADPDTRFSQRADASARFLLDPFAEQARGWYGGAGFTARRDGDAAWKGDLMLVIGVEGAARGRWIPAVEVALGGGVRMGVVLRNRRRGGIPSR
jgi:hypothetical protein